jgi:hypothetical protein
MKFAALLLVAAGIASASAASASTINTDADFLKASRCKGLAAGLGVDAAGLDAALKVEARRRVEYIQSRGYTEMARAKRQAGDANLKERLTAELNGACTAYLSPAGGDVASR